MTGITGEPCLANRRRLHVRIADVALLYFGLDMRHPELDERGDSEEIDSISNKRYSVDYDEEADVLYVSFARPQEATATEMTDEGLLLRYRCEELVGVKVLDASMRLEEV